jgi:hypothetical protein
MGKKRLNKDARVYLRLHDRETLKSLSEKTRQSQAEIISQFLNECERVMSSFPECDRVSLGIYSKGHQIQVLIAPVLSGSLQFEYNGDINKDDITSQKAVHEDIARKLEACGLENCGQHSQKVKVKACQ